MRAAPPPPVRRRPRTIAVACAATVVALVAAAACDVRRVVPAAGEPRDHLILLDSVVLRETDAHYVGHAQFLAVAGDGELFVSDRIGARVLRFGRDGAPRGALGRKGRGPGEFGGAGAVAFVGDSLVVADDLGGHRMMLFRRATGALVRMARREMGIPTQAAVAGDRVWLGHANVPRTTSLARWRLGGDSVDYVLPMPPEFRGTGLEYAQPFVAMTAWRDTILVGHAVHPLLTLADGDGAPLGTLRVPVRARRGIPEPAELLARYRAGLSAERQVDELSLLVGAWRLASGSTALLHVDLTLDSLTRRPTGGGWLTVLTPALDSACVDIPLEAPDEGWPVLAVHGDTLLRLDQRPGDGVRPRTVVRRYRVDVAGCAMVALRASDE